MIQLTPTCRNVDLHSWEIVRLMIVQLFLAQVKLPREKLGSLQAPRMSVII